MAGYSARPLRDKFGLKAGMRAAFIRMPKEVTLELGDTSDVKPLSRVGGVPFDFVAAFITSEEQLQAVLPNLKAHLKSDGQLWLAWIKRTSPRHTGLDENMIRRYGLAVGLVDVKVAALTEDWSGLKFVYRLSDRG
jgi:hypothetical protein